MNDYKIPKIIHYIWFGKNPKNRSVKKCIESWRRFCPDYKIIEWNETNYNIRKNRYMYEAYKAKKWAFVSDYARYDIIYHYGGIYLDTDVELVGNIDVFLHDQMFVCFLEDRRIASGLGFGSIAGNSILKEILQYYEGRSFYKKNGELDLRTCNHNETKVLVGHGLVRNGKEQILDYVHIYPREFFNPIDQCPTANTIAINHFDGSWTSFSHRFKRKKDMFFIRKLGKAHAILIIRITDIFWKVLVRLETIWNNK